MIVADTSALVAIMLHEPERVWLAEAMFKAAAVLIAAPTAFEYRMVMSGRRGASPFDVETMLIEPSIRIVPWTADHALIAHAAFRRYGKGRGHPAQLNFGDCMSYALAKARNLPLLYKGGDFALTDVRSAL